MAGDGGDIVGADEWSEVWDGTKFRLPIQVPPSRQADLHRAFLKHLPRGPGIRLLEVGCAPAGALVYFAEQFGYAVAGVEYTESGCRLAERNLEAAGIEGEIIHGDFFECPIAPEAFDIVYSAGFIEHFENWKTVLERKDALLRPGGWLVVAWPNLKGVNGWIFRHCCPEARIPHFVLSPEDIAASLRAMGYEIVLARPIGGPRFIMPLPPRIWGRRHDRLRRWLLLPVRLVNRLSLVAESRLKFAPTSMAFSMKCAVIARKPAP